jgi:hypothetical protein
VRCGNRKQDDTYAFIVNANDGGSWREITRVQPVTDEECPSDASDNDPRMASVEKLAFDIAH